MKKLTVLFAFFGLFALATTMVSCAGGGEKAATEIDKNSKEYASAYVCPMHCKGSGSDAAGKCPACKMDYVANKDHKSNGHNHDGHDHSHDHNHDHGDHSGHNH